MDAQQIGELPNVPKRRMKRDYEKEREGTRKFNARTGRLSWREMGRRKLENFKRKQAEKAKL